MFIQGINVPATYSPEQIQPSELGVFTAYTNMEIGIIEEGSSNLNRLPLRVPTNAIINGGKYGRPLANRRATRLTHFLNVIRAFAHDRYNLRDNETVVFIRFTD